MTTPQLASNHPRQLDPVTARLLDTTDTPPQRARRVKEFNEYCNKCIADIRKCLSRQLENMAKKRKEMFGEEHLGKVRIHDVVCHVIHPDGPSAVFASSAFDHELVKERLVQITNFLRSWQEVYTTIHFQGEERFVGSVSDPAEVSDHAALATLLKKQKTKLEEEQLQKMKNDQSIKTAVGLFATAAREKDESVAFKDRVMSLTIAFSLNPGDIDAEAKRTWDHGNTENLYKVAAQKFVGLEYHKRLNECPLYTEKAANQEDKCEKCKDARIFLDWPGRLDREYVNRENGRTAYEAKYIPYIFPSKLGAVAKEMLIKYYKRELPRLWAECKGLDPQAPPPPETNTAPVEAEEPADGFNGDVYDTFCRPHGGQSSQGLQERAAEATVPASTPPVDTGLESIENILEALANASPARNDGTLDGGGGEGRIPQSGGEEPQEEPPTIAGASSRDGPERMRPSRNAKRPFEEDYVFE